MLASDAVPGLPITSLLRGTPDAEIWKSAVLGHCEEEVVNRPEHVVYSLDPSLYERCVRRAQWEIVRAHGYRTKGHVESRISIQKESPVCRHNGGVPERCT